MERDVVVRPAGTTWGAVLDGWLATVGVAAILTPIVGLLLTNVFSARGYASTVPVLVAVGLAYLVGGYVAGRIAGYRTSWHGMMVAFFGLFVVLALLVVDVALASGALGTTSRLIQILPNVLGIALFQSVETFAFGGALSILMAIFAGWLGGLLAPSHVAAAAPAPVTAAPVSSAPLVEERRVTEAPAVEEGRVRTTETGRPRERYRLLPSPGRKGGQRADEVSDVERVDVDRVESTDRVEPTDRIERP